MKDVPFQVVKVATDGVHEVDEMTSSTEKQKSLRTKGQGLGVAVVGAGYWGKNLVRNFSSLSRARLVAICDGNPDVREVMARTYPGVRVTGDYREILQDPDVEAVVLVTPAALHFEGAKAAMEADKHVYVEKPMALSVAQAEEMVALSKAGSKVLMVGHMLVYHPVVQRVKALVDSGELGEVFYMYALRVNLGRLRSDENALWSFGPHDLSVMLYLLGEAPTSVAARGKAFLQDGIEDVVFLNLTFPRGEMAQVQLSWLDPRKERKLTVVGSRKMLEFDDTSPTEKLRIFDKGFGRPPDFDSYGEYLSIRHGDVLIPRVEMVEPLRVELLHFVDCALQGKAPTTGGQEGLEVVRILEAADRSMAQNGAPVKLTGEARSWT